MNKEILPVLDEISAVLKKHDMAGLVLVSNKTHVDWRMDIEPSWSCARIENDGKGHLAIRVRCKRVDYPSREAQKAALQATIGTFVTFSDALEKLNRNVLGLLEMLSKNVDFIGKSTEEDGFDAHNE